MIIFHRIEFNNRLNFTAANIIVGETNHVVPCYNDDCQDQMVFVET